MTDPITLDESSMAASLSPEIADYVRDLARRLDGARHGQAGALVDAAAAFLGMSRQTVYRHLKECAGWASGRKCRADKGSTSVDAEALTKLAAAQREAVRDNGKQTLFTTTGRGILEQNGTRLGVSNSQLNRLMRDRKLGVAAQRVADPVQQLRALHPNHVHEVDPSLCLVYYLKDRQHIMRDRDFYKNKLENYAKVKFKVFRYVLYDRASGAIVPWYVEAAGEDQHNLFDFLMYAWGQQPGRLFHGVPKVMLWDKGSANQSGAIKNLLEALGVQALDHQAGNARAKGGVEGANNIVETQFESRLRFEPVNSVAELNAAATAWAEAWNADLLPGQNANLRRQGLAGRVSRYDLWQLITAEQLRRLPDVDVCRALMVSKAEERLVRPNMTVSYRHPQADAPALYSLRGLEGINVGDKIMVRALVYGNNAIQIQVPRYDGETLTYRVEPETEYDRFGMPLSAAVIGEEYKSIARTEAQHAAHAMDTQAYPGLDPDQIKAARDKKAVPFNGELKSHSYLKDVEIPTFIPRSGTEIEAPAHAQAAAAPMLVNVTAALLRIANAVRRNLTESERTFLRTRFADGVPEDQLDSLIDQFINPEPAAEPVRAAGGLRAI
ncbi:MAG: integrase [Comamonas sp.]